MSLFLAPAQRRFLDASIEKGVASNHLASHLAEETAAEIQSRAGGTGIRCWAMTALRRALFEAMQPGDIVLLSEQGTQCFTHQAQVTSKVESTGLGNDLWPVTGGNPWSLIFFLREVRRIRIPKAELLTKLHYAPNFIVAGITRVSDERIPPDLRRWLETIASAENRPLSTGERILRAVWRKFAALIAEHPEELDMVEWRDLERIMREVFEGLGFETRLTRPAKDGGFDLELATVEDGVRTVYFVEIKHWSLPSRPGSGVLRNFLEVVVEQSAKGGLLLSSSGFTANVFSGITAVERRRVRLGDREKIIGLCQSYLRQGTELLLKGDTLPHLLFEKTL